MKYAPASERLRAQNLVVTQFMLFCSELKKGRSDIDNSLTFFRMKYFYLEFKWVRNCIEQHAYHQAIRELRFILESVIQAYYTDINHPNSDMVCKMEIVKELDHLYGRKLIENRDIKLKCKNEIVLLYSDLCAFVHSSYKELSSVQSRSVEELESLNFEEDSEMQEICENYVNRTIDAVFFVTLSLFPDISKLPTRFENMGKKFLENSKALRLNWTVKQWKTNIS